jgi:DtxR family Mn-dependent transcriptional regulator
MTEAAQYLLAVYMAEQDGETPVSPKRVADAVGRSPAATTEMLQRLDDRGLVVHEPYEGTELTAEGRETAADLHETYRTLARFFREVLDLEDPEGEAMELAGSVSSQVTERLAAVLLEGADSRTSPDAVSPEGN